MSQSSAVPSVLIFAGLDPSGGAGLLADAEAAREMGARPLCVPTALTVQSRTIAFGFEPVSPDYLRAAALALAAGADPRAPDDESGSLRISAVKIGMLASHAVAQALLELLEDPRLSRLPVILDPVLAASSGTSLFRGTPGEASTVIRALWNRALVTPNALEAQQLLELAEPPRDAGALESAARALVAAGAQAALVKGGHAQGGEAIDVLAESSPHGIVVTHLRGARLRGAGTGAPLSARGTGCRLAAALAAGRALGQPAPLAAQNAKALVRRYLEREGR